MINRIKNIFQNLSLKYKIIGAVVLNLIIIIIPLSIVLLFRFYLNEKENIMNTAKSNIEIISNNLITPVLFDDIDQIEEILNTSIKYENFQNIELYNDKKELINSATQEKLFKDTEKLVNEITVKSKVIAYLEIEINFNALNLQTRNYLLFLVALIFLAIIISIFIANRLQSLIKRPIDKLIEITQNIDLEKDFEIQEKNVGTDEISMLYKEFLKFLTTIDKYRKLRNDAELRLYNINTKLEKLVEDRTKDLLKANENLQNQIEEKNQIQQELYNQKLNEIENMKILMIERTKAEEKFKEQIMKNSFHDETTNQIIKIFNSEFNTNLVGIDKQLEFTDQAFISRLTEKYTDITASEAKLASLIRNGLNTKDSALILHISPKTVENHRSSIRKKLKLPKTKNLSIFLSEI